ncbi:MAG: CBS domain-containing protein [Steroidobacteraceae bacterium]
MIIGEICTREVTVVRSSDALSQAARQMCERHVGTVIVVEDRGKQRVPIGIITDRDIVRAQLNRVADLSCLGVAQVMTPDPLVLSESETMSEAIEKMRARAVRRAPVVNATGGLVGVISMDDLLSAISEQLSGLVRLVEVQQRREAA